MATGAFDARAEAARGDEADPRAVRRQDLGAVAHRRAAQRAEADALARRAVAQARAGCARRPESRRRRAASLGDGEGEVGLDRRGGLVEVVAVERQARLQAERIARAEADRLHLRLGEQRAGDRLRVAAPGRRSRSRPRRYSRSARRSSRCRRTRRSSRVMKTRLSTFGQWRAMHLRRLRPLQREERPVVGGVERERRRAVARRT